MSLESQLREAFADKSIAQQNATIDIARTYLFSTTVVTELSEKDYDSEATELWMNFMFNNSAAFLLERVGMIEEASEAHSILNRIAEVVKVFANKVEKEVNR